MLRLLTATSLLLLAIVLPAIAQTGNPAFTPSGTPASKPGVPAPHQLNAADRTVIQRHEVVRAEHRRELEVVEERAVLHHAHLVAAVAETMLLANGLELDLGALPGLER